MEKITIEATINAPMDKVWEYYTSPEKIRGWAFASDTWEVGEVVTNDVVVNGRFRTDMRAKDGSASFPFEGTYTLVEKEGDTRKMQYKMDDNRMVDLTFQQVDGGVKVTTVFDPESQNPIEMQREGWQAILNNFKKLVETN